MSYQIRWRITNRCNYDCPYCIQTDVPKKVRSEKEEIKNIMATAKSIKRLIDKDDKEDFFNIQINGGEISVFKKGVILAAIEELKSEKIHNIYIESNFSEDISWYIDVAKRIKDDGMTCRYKFSLHESGVYYKDFLAKLIDFTKKDRDTEVRAELVVTRENYNTTTPYFVELCTKQNIPFIIDYDEKEEWKEEDKIYVGTVKKTRTIQAGTSDTYGFSCSGSVFQMNVMSNGEVFTNSCRGKKSLGLIYLMKEIPRVEMLCDEHSCNCCGKLLIKDKEGKVWFDGLKEID